MAVKFWLSKVRLQKVNAPQFGGFLLFGRGRVVAPGHEWQEMKDSQP